MVQLVMFALLALLLLAYAAYLYAFRSAHLAALGSIVPTVLGPVLAYQYLQAWQSPLWVIVEGGGDVLVQLAFFFASLVGLVIYLLMKSKEEDAADMLIARLGWAIVVIILLVLAMNGRAVTTADQGAGPEFLPGAQAPRPSWFLLCRALLVWYPIVRSTFPSKDRSHV